MHPDALATVNNSELPTLHRVTGAKAACGVSNYAGIHYRLSLASELSR
jgi:hypothetical protein